MSQITAFDATAEKYVSAVGDSANSALRVNQVASESDNTDVVLMASAAHTTTQQTADMANKSYTTAMVSMNVTAYGSTGNITLSVLRKDPASGNYETIGSKTIAATGQIGLNVGIGANVVGNYAAVTCPLPPTWAVKVTPPDASSNTYSVSISLMR